MADIPAQALKRIKVAKKNKSGALDLGGIDLTDENMSEVKSILSDPALKSLTSLSVGWNRLGSLPEWMGELKNLTSLDVSWNDLGSLPEWMGELTNLTSLDVSWNDLGSLPEWMGKLTNLTSLHVGG